MTTAQPDLPEEVIAEFGARLDGLLARLDAFDPDEPRDESGKWSESGSTLYHVTHSKHAKKIKQQGVRPMGAASNWVKGEEGGERYGKGEVYAFTHKDDAVRWAAKMDWEFNKGSGTGKISIVHLTGKQGDQWLIDESDPLSQATAKGKWLKRNSAVPAARVASVEPLTQDMVRDLVKRQNEGTSRADFDPGEPRDEAGKWSASGKSLSVKDLVQVIGGSGKHRDIDVTINPTEDDMLDMLHADKRHGGAGMVRVLKNDNGDVYAWNAMDAVHQEIARSLDMENPDYADLTAARNNNIVFLDSDGTLKLTMDEPVTTYLADERVFGRADWDESEHPRAPKGEATGGEFVAAGGGGAPAEGEEHPSQMSIMRVLRRLGEAEEMLRDAREAGNAEMMARMRPEVQKFRERKRVLEREEHDKERQKNWDEAGVPLQNEAAALYTNEQLKDQIAPGEWTKLSPHERLDRRIAHREVFDKLPIIRKHHYLEQAKAAEEVRKQEQEWDDADMDVRDAAQTLYVDERSPPKKDKLDFENEADVKQEDERLKARAAAWDEFDKLPADQKLPYLKQAKEKQAAKAREEEWNDATDSLKDEAKDIYVDEKNAEAMHQPGDAKLSNEALMARREKFRGEFDQQPVDQKHDYLKKAEEERIAALPQSWDDLGQEDQDQARHRFFRRNMPAAVDQEIEYWKDNGGRLDHAKTDMAYEHNHGEMHETPEWFADAIDNVIEKRAEEDPPLPPVPYDKDTLRNAIKLDYESNGEGSGTLEVSFDADKLKAPEGYDPRELTLPGIEPEDPSKRLTDEMRAMLMEEVADAFDREANRKEVDIEPDEQEMQERGRDVVENDWDNLSDTERFANYSGQKRTAEGTTEIKVVKKGGTEWQWVPFRAMSGNPGGLEDGEDYSVEMAINPTLSDIENIMRHSSRKVMRLLRTTDGKVYAWDATTVTHPEVIDKLDLDVEDTTVIWGFSGMRHYKKSWARDEDDGTARSDDASELLRWDDSINPPPWYVAADVEWYARADAWEETDHPRGQPTNKGQFVTKGEQTEGMTIQKSGAGLYDARVNGEYAGHAQMAEGHPFISSMHVHEDHEQKGIGQALHDHIEKQIGRPLVPNPLHMDDRSRAIWQKRLSDMGPQEAKKRLTEARKIGHENFGRKQNEIDKLHQNLRDTAGGGRHPGHGYSARAFIDDTGRIHTDSVYDAARALYEKKDVVLASQRTVSTLIEHLGKVSAEMIRLGGDAPVFDLCHVAVPDTNLFCAESKGIPRVQMPQLDDEDTKRFKLFLQAKGYKLSKESEKASYLKATQNELNGAKVAANAKRIMENPDKKMPRIIISRDNYVLDGHHRWAALLGIDAANNRLGDIDMRVTRVNIGITELLKETELFGAKTGAGVEAGTPSAGGQKGKGYEFVSPNEKELKFQEAIKSLKGEHHQYIASMAENVDKELGLKAKVTPVIGVWADGAENSTLTTLKRPTWSQLVASASMKGHLANQKQVLIFRENDRNPNHGDSGFLAHFHAKGDLAEISKFVSENGLPYHTLEPDKDGANVYVYGNDEETAHAARTAGAYYGSTVEAHPGRGAFLGTQKQDGTDQEQRADARGVYEREIAGAGLQGAATVWQGLRDRYGGQAQGQQVAADSFVSSLPSTLVKVLMSASSRPLQFVRADAWDESKHPRGQPENAGEFASAGGGGAKVPEEPGKSAIPEGRERRYHYTSTANAEGIAKEGIKTSHSTGKENREPVAVWSNPDNPYERSGIPSGKALVEYHADPQISARHPYASTKDVPPEDIVAIHHPWHERYRYAKENGLTPQQLREAGGEDYEKAASALEAQPMAAESDDIEDKLANMDGVTDMTDYIGEASAGFLAPSGRMYDIGGRAHHEVKEELGQDIAEDGYARIYLVEGDMLGVDANAALTNEQVKFLIDAADTGKFTRLVVEGPISNSWQSGRRTMGDTVEPPGGLRGTDVRRFLGERGMQPEAEQYEEPRPRAGRYLKELGFKVKDSEHDTTYWESGKGGLYAIVRDHGDWWLDHDTKAGMEGLKASGVQLRGSNLADLLNTLDRLGVPGATALRDKERAERIHAAMPEKNYEIRKAKIKTMAAGLSKRTNFNPGNILYESQPKEFNLGGVMHTYAGAADPNGMITLWPNQMHGSDENIGSMIVHEIEHQKFHYFLKKYDEEYAAIQKIPGAFDTTRNVTNSDGTLKPPYDKQFPFYTAYTTLISTQLGKLAEDDGVSDYSREWWKAYGSLTVKRDQAIHETLAEMAANQHLMKGESRLLGPEDEKGEFHKSATGGSKRWQDLYATVNRMWDEHHEASGWEKAA